MKKIFYILASAIVALGAVACENEGMENIAPEVNGDTVSFVANIDNTKTDLNGLQTVWTAGDEITVTWNDKDYTFTNSANNLNTFSCTAEGLSAIQGANVEAWYNKDGVDSSAGTAGAQLYAEGSFGELKFEIKSAFLKFTTTEEVVLAGDGLFNNAAAFYTGTDVYVAINPVEATLSYSVAGVTCKSLTKNFEAGNIYNLGYLGKLSDWYVWDEGAQQRINMYEEYGLAVAHITTKNNIKISNGSDWIGKQYNDTTPKDSWYFGSDYESQINISNNGTLHVYFDTYAKKWYLSDKNEVPTFLSVIGTIGGSNWDKDFAMTWENGYYVVTVTAAANNEFKIRHLNSWDYNHGYGDWFEAGDDLVSDNSGNFKITAAGTYKISIKQDLTKIKIEKL